MYGAGFQKGLVRVAARLFACARAELRACGGHGASKRVKGQERRGTTAGGRRRLAVCPI